MSIDDPTKLEETTPVLDILVTLAQREAVAARLRSLEVQAWNAKRRHEQAVADFNRAMGDLKCEAGIAEMFGLPGHINPHLKLD